jgi:hypothetical protein
VTGCESAAEKRRLSGWKLEARDGFIEGVGVKRLALELQPAIAFSTKNMENSRFFGSFPKTKNACTQLERLADG